MAQSRLIFGGYGPKSGTYKQVSGNRATPQQKVTS